MYLFIFPFFSSAVSECARSWHREELFRMDRSVHRFGAPVFRQLVRVSFRFIRQAPVAISHPTHFGAHASAPCVHRVCAQNQRSDTRDQKESSDQMDVLCEGRRTTAATHGTDGGSGRESRSDKSTCQSSADVQMGRLNSRISSHSAHSSRRNERVGC